VSRFQRLVSELKLQYGAPAVPDATGPFELVMWENACYLMTDERRREVMNGLRHRVGLTPSAILGAHGDVLLELATRGGMRPETRVFRWLEIARITLDQFGGDLDKVLKLPITEAKRALKQFPNIGDPGAEKILMFCGVAEGLPLESNGLRVLTRFGYGREEAKNYGRMYRSVQEALKGELPGSSAELAASHLLLRQHGKEICRTNEPVCSHCCVTPTCGYAAKQMQRFLV
jgi:endonuclease-3